MPRGLALLLVFGACGYPPLANLSDGAGTDAPPGDGAISDDAVTKPTSFCNPEDPNLVVCYEFEGNTRDGSSHGLDATPADISYVAGKVGLAMQFGAASSANVAPSTVFDVPALTIEAWIQPALLPLDGAQSSILDVDSQYAFVVNADGTLTCDLQGGPSVSNRPVSRLTVGKWAHVACTYDGQTVARIYIDGVEQAARTGSGPLATGGHAMAIAANSPSGSPLIGLIDQLRLMRVARAPLQICADSGNASCP